MKYSGDKDIDQFIRQLLREGWNYRRGRKHGRLVAPGGKYFVTIAGSPSDRRSFDNFQRDVRKIGKGMTLDTAGSVMEPSPA